MLFHWESPATRRVIPGNSEACAKKSARFWTCKVQYEPNGLLPDQGGRTYFSKVGLYGRRKFFRYQRNVAIVMFIAPFVANDTTICGCQSASLRATCRNAGYNERNMKRTHPYSRYIWIGIKACGTTKFVRSAPQLLASEIQRVAAAIGNVL
jgi:hypothetical protein